MPIRTWGQVLRYLSGQPLALLERITPDTASQIREIRLRSMRPLCVVTQDGEYAVRSDGTLTAKHGGEALVTRQTIEEIFRSICSYSVHSHQQDIVQGFVTLHGGHRAGVTGTAVMTGEQMTNVKNISSINIRIASQIPGCAQPLVDALPTSPFPSVLVSGAPMSGKTTILRDICRILSDTYRLKVALVDERGEIASVCDGVAQNDVGVSTDVLDGYPKAQGMEIAIRSMSPNVIVCDEIGCAADADSVLSCMNAGVSVVASVHAGTLEELYARVHIAPLLRQGVFRYVAILGTGKDVGQVRQLVQLPDG